MSDSIGVAIIGSGMHGLDDIPESSHSNIAII